MTATPTEEITRDDLESKLREIEDIVDETARNWSMLIVGGAVVIGVAVIGWRLYRSRTQRVTVEVYTNP